jgi:hypothetical protein
MLYMPMMKLFHVCSETKTEIGPADMCRKGREQFGISLAVVPMLLLVITRRVRRRAEFGFSLSGARRALHSSGLICAKSRSLGAAAAALQIPSRAMNHN